MGKSNLLQHLSDSEVQGYHMGSQAENFRAIIIDANMIGPLPTTGDTEQFRCWAGFELMMHRLLMAFYPLTILEEDSERFLESYHLLQDGTNPLHTYMALRYFETGLEYFMQRDIRIAFMFDEFEVMLNTLPVKFFQTLRGIRDAHKKQIMYLTFTRAPLSSLIANFDIPPLEIESFIELFTDNVHYIGPYNDLDAARMLDDLARRSNVDYPEPVRDLIAAVTGCYAGLLRATFNALETINNPNALMGLSVTKAAEFLIHQAPIETECRTIWTSLNPHEQYMLKVVARQTDFTNSSETERAIKMLGQKQLLRVLPAEQRLQIEPPIFRIYVKKHNPEPTQERS
ncbi:MAG: hypothetical protein GYB67_06715 [Chloroflexi bacterium]|nr:hypothetical protein [Chloroflexota bacterium]